MPAFGTLVFELLASLALIDVIAFHVFYESYPYGSYKC